MNALLRADLHVHSKYSTRPSQWVLQKLGCAESYTEPMDLYRIAKARGMDLVTITDHNTLSGSLEIAHLPDAFVSVEITAYFPEDGCKAHVLAYDITEAQFAEINKVRENVYDLASYLRGQGILHVLAHPMYAVNDRLTVEHFEKMLLLFKNMELNGARDGAANDALQAIVAVLTEETILRLADKHGMAPTHEEPWIKRLTGGSDDHSSLNIARIHTEVLGATDAASFLAGVAGGAATPKGDPSTPKSLAHNLYSIAYQFYKQKFGLSRSVNHDLLLRFADNVLTAGAKDNGGFIGRLHGLIGYKRPAELFRRQTPRSIREVVARNAKEIVASDPGLKRLVESDVGASGEMEEDVFRFVSKASQRVLKHFADNLLESVSGANLFDIFTLIGSSGSLYTLLSPYFLSFSLFTQDRAFADSCRARLAEARPKPDAASIKIGHFTDTFHEVNGVALTLRRQLKISLKHDLNYRIVTCGRTPGFEGVINFEPIGSFELPEYPELVVSYPPFLTMLNRVFEEGFTHLHAATPGPMGLAALGVSKILKLPIHATYHTALPQYASELTGDTGMEDMVWKFVIWFYNQVDVVFAPSRAVADELAARGVNKEKIKVYPRGIDTERFTPGKRNGFFKRYGLDRPVKLLYVGRVSKEKNLAMLSEAFRNLCAKRADLHLVVVGEGPYLDEMREELKGLPATFTGYLDGEELASAYASSDLFVFPSTTDTFGNVVLEAQASGLPVIVSDQGGPCENMIPGATGLVMPSCNAEGLMQAMETLASDRQMRTTMGQAAREAMEERSFETQYLKAWKMYADDPDEKKARQAA
ncbi:MAG: glycosyltransferase [Desulfovibrionaceae bacterium]